MKILLIYPRYHWIEHNGMAEPIGILMLHANLKQKGYDVDFLDLTFCDDISVYKDRINAADVIGYSISAALFNSFKEVIRLCKEINNHAFYLAGGMHPTSNPDEVLVEGIECCFLGESDVSFPEFLSVYTEGKDWHGCDGISYFDENHQLVKNKRSPYVTDLDSLPHPSRYLIDYPKYAKNGLYEVGMVSSRGCPARCIICKPTMDDIFGCGTRFRGAADVLSEIKEICEQLKTKHPYIYFKDDTITLQGKKWFMELYDGLKKEGIHLKWHCNTRVDTVDFELLKLMKKTGVHCISFGVEAGSQRILDFYRKDITPEQTIQAFDWCHKVGIESTANIILGAPIETREELEMTYQLIKRIRPDDTSVYFCTALPGKHLYTIARELGYLHRVISYEEYDTARNRDLENINMALDSLTMDDLKEYKTKILRYKAWRKLTSFHNIWEWTKEAITHPGMQLKKAWGVFKMLWNNLLRRKPHSQTIVVGGRGDGGYR